MRFKQFLIETTDDDIAKGEKILDKMPFYSYHNHKHTCNYNSSVSDAIKIAAIKRDVAAFRAMFECGMPISDAVIDAALDVDAEFTFRLLYMEGLIFKLSPMLQRKILFNPDLLDVKRFGEIIIDEVADFYFGSNDLMMRKWNRFREQNKN